MTLKLTHIYRYPVKGLNCESLTTTTLTPGEGLKHDRRFAIALGTTEFDPASPQWLSKTNFLMLMRNAGLARLDARFDSDFDSDSDSDSDSGTSVLTLRRGDHEVARGDLSTIEGRGEIEAFFAATMGDETGGAPRILEAPGHMFSDTPPKVVSIIGLASLRDLETSVGSPVDHRRFRANLYFDGGVPWRELSWPGKEITIGGARLKVIACTDRCAATNVNPDTAERDLNIPKSLMKGFGHVNMGVYAEVLEGGAIHTGDEIGVPE